MTRTISCGIPYALRMRHRLSQWMLSKAFSKSTKLMYNCLCHSVHCLMMFRRVNIWSVHPLPGRKPACSLRSCWSTASSIRLMMIFVRILLGTDRRVIPLQLLQYLKAPFFAIFTMTPSVQSSGSCFSSQMAVKSG